MTDAATLQSRTARHAPGSIQDLSGFMAGLQLESFCQLTDGAVMLHFADGSEAHVDLANGKVTTREPGQSPAAHTPPDSGQAPPDSNPTP